MSNSATLLPLAGFVTLSKSQYESKAYNCTQKWKLGEIQPDSEINASYRVEKGLSHEYETLFV